MYDALVLSGGGINGLTHVGCLAGLGPDITKDVDTVVGTSAGSLVAAIWCLNLDLRGVFRTLYAMDRARLGSVSFESVMTTFGLDDGRGLKTLVETFIPPAVTFADILRDTGKTLLVPTTCLTDSAAVVFGPVTHPDVPVALAVRMSCSIPLVFAGVWHDAKLYVDGSVLNNFPMDIAFARKKKRVLGIAVSHFHERATGIKISTLGDFSRALMGTVISKAQERRNFPKSSAVIDLWSAVPAHTLFDVTDTQLAYLYNLGYVKGRDFRRKIQ